MKIYILLALVSYVCAADIPAIQCPDGNICNVGKTCCEKSGYFECCDIPELERQNKKLVPASSYSEMKNVSRNDINCPTQCGEYHCCPYYHATCCPNYMCCPSTGANCCSGNKCCAYGYRCCGSGSSPWCCRKNQRCSSSYGYCRAAAAALSPALFSVIAVFFIVVSLKNF